VSLRLALALTGDDNGDGNNAHKSYCEAHGVGMDGVLQSEEVNEEVRLLVVLKLWYPAVYTRALSSSSLKPCASVEAFNLAPFQPPPVPFDDNGPFNAVRISVISSSCMCALHDKKPGKKATRTTLALVACGTTGCGGAVPLLRLKARTHRRVSKPIHGTVILLRHFPLGVFISPNGQRWVPRSVASTSGRRTMSGINRRADSFGGV